MSLDLTNQTQLFLGLFEKEIHKPLSRFAKGINSVIDVGAAEGEYTLFALLKTSARRVFAFEPDPRNCSLFESNLGSNSLKADQRLICRSQYVGADDGVGTCTLDWFVKDIVYPCLIKIDVDGGEVDVLTGASQILAKSEVRLIIETHSNELEVACMDVLTRAGFKAKIIPKAWWRLAVPETRPLNNRWLIAAKEPGLL